MPEPESFELSAPDTEATLALGARLAHSLPLPLGAPLVMGLTGELGTGKTTFVRGFLGALGVTDLVRSPTYTLLEEYDAGSLRVAHLDLYRLRSPAEIDELGIPDLLEGNRVLLIEWPERGAEALPPIDLTIALEFADSGRRIRFRPHTAVGRSLAAATGAYSGRRSD